MKVNWIIQKRMLNGPGYANNLPAAVTKNGFEIQLVENIDECTTPPPDEAVVVWGSLPFARRLANKPWTPGVYLRLENLRFSAFASHFSDVLLSDDFMILPFAEAVRRRLTGFWRPNESTKSFTGLVITSDNFDLEINTLRQISHVQPEELVVIASPREIEAEYRYVVVDGEVIAHSSYSWTGDPTPNTDARAFVLASDIARMPWQPDRIYVCDIAKTPSGPKLIEFNGFSTAGIYCCDPESVVKYVSYAAWDEISGD